MNLISIENISKSFTEKKLLENISFGIDDGDKIGIIGINGTGKSTLLKIIAGEETPDGGRIIRGNSVTVGYLHQNPDFDEDATVIEQVFKGNSPVMKVIREYEAAIHNPNTPSEIIIKLTQQMDTMNAWELESEAKTILTKLGIEDFNSKVGILSGGQKKRIALATALINPSDLLILDEPTNHLDNDSIDWLEQYLNNRKGALLMITHDRYFLDRVVNQILELERGNLYSYKGNYSVFLEKKLEREELEIARERKRDNLYRRELAWIKRGARARSTKQKARIERFEKLSEETFNTDKEKLEISVGSSRLGRKVVEVEHIGKSYDKDLIKNFSYILLRDDRIGIIGPNGSGKSTLMNIICGRLKPDTGKVEIGETVKLGVFSQESSHMDENQRVIEYIKDAADYITTANGDKITASQMLERFLFPADLQWSFISKLSGGERRRLQLLRVLMEAPNVLLLDEPTNDLDIETLTILEDYIEEFPGAVIVVSHDRYFLDKMVNRIFAFEGNGEISQYEGNYSDYKVARDRKQNMEEPKTKNISTKDKENYKEKKEKPLKFSFNEQREFDEIDEVIESLEKKLQEIEVKIQGASNDYVLLQELLAEKETLEKQLEEKMERWVYLNELAAKIANK